MTVIPAGVSGAIGSQRDAQLGARDRAVVGTTRWPPDLGAVPALAAAVTGLRWADGEGLTEEWG